MRFNTAEQLAFRPPEEITVSEWAAKRRVLARHAAIKGPYSLAFVPFFVPIMDACASWDINEVVVQKPAQIGGTDAFVLKLAANGRSLIFSTFLGGGKTDAGRAIAVNADGAISVAGCTLSRDFPSFGGLGNSYAGNQDAFLTKLSAIGTKVLYSAYFGGKGLDDVYGLAVGPDNVLYCDLDRGERGIIRARFLRAPYYVLTGLMQIDHRLRPAGGEAA